VLVLKIAEVWTQVMQPILKRKLLPAMPRLKQHYNISKTKKNA